MIELIIRYLFPVTYRAIRGEGYQAAIKDILVFKDKIYTEQVTLSGDYQSIGNVTCLGSKTAMKFVSPSPRPLGKFERILRKKERKAARQLENATVLRSLV